MNRQDSPAMRNVHADRVCLTVLLVGIMMFFVISYVGATTIDSQDLHKVSGDQATRENVPQFSYRLEGRPDPFVPFITPKAATPRIDPNEIVEEEVELTGMRQFEPGQLVLVATIFSGKTRLAMVEDVTGKGYVLHEGTPIGRRGVVSQINRQQVVITQTAHTRAGKEIVTTVVMRLKKEGEK